MTNNDEFFEDTYDDEQPIGSKNEPEPSNDRKVWMVIGISTIGVVMAGAWLAFVNNENILTTLIVLALPVALSYGLYRYMPTRQNEFILLGMNAGYAWLVFRVGMNWLLFVYAGVLTLLVPLRILRNIRGSEEEAFTRARDRLNKPVPPSKRARRSMTGQEAMWQEEPRHPIVFTPVVVVVLVAAFLTGFAPWSVAMLYFWAIFLSALALVYLLWRRDHICFTDWRVFRSYGIFSRKTQEMAYSDMTDKSTKIPWHSLLLAKLRIIDVPYGTLKLESAGQVQALTILRWIRNVEALKVKIAEETRRETKADA